MDRAIVEAIPLPSLLIDRRETITVANAAARDLLGKGIEGRRYSTMLRQPRLYDVIAACIATNSAQSTRYQISSGEREATLRVSCRPIAEHNLVLVCFEDVSGAEHAEQMRRDFVANVSHELRTPLTALIGFIDTLSGAARNDPEAQKRFLDIMASEANRMNRLVGDLLSLSRVEEGERIRPTCAVDLADLLRATLATFSQTAEATNVTVGSTFDPIPLPVLGDSDQLRQVFSNLVENAIKYGGSGGQVEVSLSFVERDVALRGPAAQIEFRDFGPGIDPLHLPRLTQRFYRADNHRSREMGGTGLGLAIVKHIVNRHRGRLRISSELGEGAVFTVLLPCVTDTVA